MIKKGDWLEVTVQGYDGRQYVASGRFRGFVEVDGVRKARVEGFGFDLLFDREMVVSMKKMRRPW